MRGATAVTKGDNNIGRFQSTRPMRGATIGVYEVVVADTVSIHAPHAGRDGGAAVLLWDKDVSIHAPHAGRDSRHEMGCQRSEKFQSTRPMRGATLAIHKR